MALFNNLFGNKEPKFKKGDTVKCINDIQWGNDKNTNITLQYGKKYVVLDITHCICCGHECLDIGGRFNNTMTFTICHLTKKDIQGRGIHWAGAYRFEKTTEQKEHSKQEIEKEIEDAVKEEKYELAGELKHKLEKIQ